MFTKKNLLSAGLMVVLTAVGQTSAMAGAGSGGHGSSGGGAHFSMPSAVKNVSQGNSFKTQQFQTNHLNTVLQSNKFNQVSQIKLNQGTLNNVTKLNHMPLSSNVLKGNFPISTVNPGFNKPIMPIKPICPPYYGTGKCGTGGCWGNYGGCWGNYGNCCNFGCGNWTFGNYGCGLGCGYGYNYYPWYFGTCYNSCYAPLLQPYPINYVMVP